MRKALVASAFALLVPAAVPAQAMPFPSLSDTPSAATLVAYGCGPGWTRGPYGHCHPIGAYYGYHPYYYHGYYHHHYYHPYYHHYYHPYYHRYYHRY